MTGKFSCLSLLPSRQEIKPKYICTEYVYTNISKILGLAGFTLEINLCQCA